MEPSRLHWIYCKFSRKNFEHGNNGYNLCFKRILGVLCANMLYRDKNESECH